MKTCDFDIQILVQNKKENLSKQISQIEKIKENLNSEKLKEVSKNYVRYILKKRDENKLSTKEFYIVIKYDSENKLNYDESINTNQNLIIQTLNDRYFKIKETLSRCGNLIYDINSKQEVQEIFYSFLNPNN